jgi:ribosomal protein L29
MKTLERFLDVDLPKINEVLAEVPWEELQKRINELKEEQGRVEAD